MYNQRERDYITVKYGYSELAYNELMLTVKGFSLPITLIHVVNLMDTTNFSKRSKMACPCHFVIRVFYCIPVCLNPLILLVNCMRSVFVALCL